MNTLLLESTATKIALPPTQGIKYAGSKLKLLPYILSLLSKVRPLSVFDAFSGTTRVAQALARSGYTVTANDISTWSEIFGTCYLLNRKPTSSYFELIDHLNNLPPEDGWFTEHYGGDSSLSSSSSHNVLKKPWQRHNTQKLDAIRREIDRLQLGDVERAVALTSLILALDEVDNTLGHFASYLNKWSTRSFKTLQLKIPLLIENILPHTVHRGDVFDVSKKVSVDLAYFDPPYGSNNEKMPPSRVRYAAYYHLWTTVCLNDKPKLFGKAYRRQDSSDMVASSVFEEYRRDPSGQFIALKAIEKLLQAVDAKFILLSYSSGGRATTEELHEIITRNGSLLEVLELGYKRNVMANMRWTNNWVREAERPNKEFLFLMKKK